MTIKDLEDSVNLVGKMAVEEFERIDGLFQSVREKN